MNDMIAPAIFVALYCLIAVPCLLRIKDIRRVD